MKIGGSKETIVQIDLHSISPSPLRRSAVPQQRRPTNLPVCISCLERIRLCMLELRLCLTAAPHRPHERATANQPIRERRIRTARLHQQSAATPCHPRRGSQSRCRPTQPSITAHAHPTRMSKQIVAARRVDSCSHGGRGAEPTRRSLVRSLVVDRCTISGRLQPRLDARQLDGQHGSHANQPSRMPKCCCWETCTRSQPIRRAGCFAVTSTCHSRRAAHASIHSPLHSASHTSLLGSLRSN